MPVELLPLAFGLTLVANAALIALAIRALRGGRADGSPSTRWLPPNQAARHPTVAPIAATPVALAPAETPPPGPRQAPDDPPRAAAVHLDETQPRAAPVDLARALADVLAETRQSRARPAAGADQAPAPRRPRPPATDSDPPPISKRSRRRFSLPPLDDDHEKVNRSIESFLGGGDQPAAPPAAPDGASGAPAPTRRSRSVASATPTAPRAATTIAVVALGGLSGPSAESAAPGEVPLDDAVVMLERTLRSAARGSDEVHVDGHGRFRIILPATGELAARAYIRRIRATVEPQLEASDRPLHLVVATATALDVPIRTAARAANRRLDAALAARPGGSTSVEAGGQSGSDEPEPRAAGD